MKIHTLSIIAGTTACNASCPYCISKMTPKQGICMKEPEVNWRNFGKACRLAQISGVTTVLMTGKGEPTLFPEQITGFLENMKKFDFPLVELQTNGILFEKHPKKFEKYLDEWYNLGLTMIAISVVHYDKEKNARIFSPKAEYPELENLIKNLHKHRFSVRLSCTMIRDYIDSLREVKKMIKYAKKWNVEQLSIRKLATPLKTKDREVFRWANKHLIGKANLKKIKQFLDKHGHKIMTLAHGASIYDVDGQNVCLTDALTIKPESDNLRQIIFFPDGHLKFDWQFPGAVLI